MTTHRSVLAAALLTGLVITGCSTGTDVDATPQAAVESSASVPAPADRVVSVTPDAVEFAPSPLVDGATGTTLIGDPTADGLYVLLGEIAAGVVFPTHTHPDDRLTTVVAGTMHLKVADGPYTAYPAGSVLFTPAGTPHTMWARDGLIRIQEAGNGPTGLDLVDAQS